MDGCVVFLVYWLRSLQLQGKGLFVGVEFSV